MDNRSHKNKINVVLVKNKDILIFIKKININYVKCYIIMNKLPDYENIFRTNNIDKGYKLLRTYVPNKCTL